MLIEAACRQYTNAISSACAPFNGRDHHNDAIFQVRKDDDSHQAGKQHQDGDKHLQKSASDHACLGVPFTLSRQKKSFEEWTNRLK